MESRARATLKRVAGALALGLLLRAWVFVDAADITRTINYQGFLTDASTGLPIDAIKDLQFVLFDAETGGAAQFTDTRCQSGGDGPGIGVVQGRYEVEIGSETAGGIPPAVFTGRDAVWLEVRVDPDDNCALFENLSPRIRLQGAPYAFKALHASTATNLTSLTNVTINYDSDNNASGVLDVQTGGASALFIDNAGQVGIGTTNPGNDLNVHSGILQITSASSGNSSTAGLQLSMTGDTAYIGNRQNDHIIFHTNGGIEKMRLTNAGNLGIGTTSPSTRLHVANDLGATSGFKTVASANRGTGNNTGVIFGYLADGTVDVGGVVGTSYGAGAGRPLIFATTPSGVMTERMRIETGGDVGIGTTNPGTALEVVGTITTDGIRSDGGTQNSKIIGSGGTSQSKVAALEVQGSMSGTSYAGYFRETGSGTNIGVYASAEGTGTNYAAIFDQGNVGIGTTSPGSELEVNGTISASTITAANIFIDQGRGSGFNYNTFLSGTGGGRWVDGGSNTNGPTGDNSGALIQFDPLRGVPDQFRVQMFFLGSGEDIYMRREYSAVWRSWRKLVTEDSSGNVGIGTTLPRTALHVSGDITQTAASGRGVQSIIHRKATVASGLTNLIQFTGTSWNNVFLEITVIHHDSVSRAFLVFQKATWMGYTDLTGNFTQISALLNVYKRDPGATGSGLTATIAATTLTIGYTNNRANTGSAEIKIDFWSENANVTPAKL